MGESAPNGCNILVYAKVRDVEAREQLRALLEDLPGERVSSTVYEVVTHDWDPGLWVETVERIQSIIDSSTDTLVYWQAVGDRLVRTCVAGRFV